MGEKPVYGLPEARLKLAFGSEGRNLFGLRARILDRAVRRRRAADLHQRCIGPCRPVFLVCLM